MALRFKKVYLVSALIVFFWLIMTFLFINREIIPSLPSLIQPSYESYLKSSEFDKETSMGIYFRDQRIGSSETIISSLDNKMTRIDNLTRISLPMIMSGLLFPSRSSGSDRPVTPTNMGALGIGMMETTGYSIIDFRYRLKSFSFKVKSPVMNYDIDGKVKDDKLEYKIFDGVKSSRQTIPFKSSSTVSDGLSPFISMPHLTVGKEWAINYINPFSPSMQTLKAKVEQRTQIDWQDKQYDVFEVTLTDPKMPKTLNYTAYITPEGRILKQEILLPGLYLIREETKKTDEKK